MNQQKLIGYFNEVLKSENLPAVPLKFCRISKGVACVSYVNPKNPIEVQLDLNRCSDPEYALLHEIAHLKQMFGKGNPGHNAAFKKEEARMVDQYMYSNISMKYFA